MRRAYILLLRLHPKTFRQRFGEQMLGIFEESPEKAALVIDGLASLFRQRTLRRHAVAFSPTVAADGVPLFYSAEPEVPRMGTLMPGALVTLIAFGLIYLTMGHPWKQAQFIVGSHHPSGSHILGAHTDAKAAADLPAEVTVKPYPFHPPISAYFRTILVLGALDLDQNNEISAAEIENAPAALWKLDKNHDGKLSAEECGLKPDPNLDPSMLGHLRLTFLRTNPVLAALDANQDGEISGDEIRNAAAALRRLDTNQDGRLVERELLPDRAGAMAANIMMLLDRNGDGKIGPEERRGPAGARFRDILDRADRTGKGYVTEDDLALELSRR